MKLSCSFIREFIVQTHTLHKACTHHFDNSMLCILTHAHSPAHIHTLHTHILTIEQATHYHTQTHKHIDLLFILPSSVIRLKDNALISECDGMAEAQRVVVSHSPAILALVLTDHSLVALQVNIWVQQATHFSSNWKKSSKFPFYFL